MEAVQNKSVITVFIEASQYSNLASECLVMIKSFYTHDPVHSVSEPDHGDIQITDLQETGFELSIGGTCYTYCIEDSRLFLNTSWSGSTDTKTLPRAVKKEQSSMDSERNEITRMRMNKDLRYFVKIALYDKLSTIHKKQLPWGILQGIRPIKLVFKLYRELTASLEPSDDFLEYFDAKQAEILDILSEGYLVNLSMARLAIEVAKQEAPYLPHTVEAARKKCSVYISIPFCPTRCHYCSFPSNSLEQYQGIITEYLNTVLLEWDACVTEILRTREISCLYIGGGTPSSLSADQLEYLLVQLQKRISFSSIREITVEAGRPDTITKAKLAILKKYGIHRISINPQTMHQCTLDIMGRDHTVGQLRESYALAKSLDFQRVNMDLIIGLPNEDLKMVSETVKEVAAMEPSEITVHTLAIKRSSVVNEHKENYQLPTEQETNDMVEWSIKYLVGEHGYRPYYLYRQKNMVVSHENIGYYKGIEPCIYNIEIMEEVIPIVALGAGAISKEIDIQGNPVRSENIKNVKLYIERIEEMIRRKKDVFKMEM